MINETESIFQYGQWCFSALINLITLACTVMAFMLSLKGLKRLYVKICRDVFKEDR